MDTKQKVTPKDFFLWLGAVVTLYASIYSLISLLFEYINYTFPDPLQYWSGDPYSGAISYAMASLIVLVPASIVVLHLIRSDISRTPEKAELWVRRWAIVLTLFLAGGVIVIDLITLINTFLSGDLTTRFILKVVVVLLVAGAGFLHFLADLRGYWIQNRTQANMVGIAFGVVALASIVSGFFIIGTPGEARLSRFDSQKVNDLQVIQGQIVNYWMTKEKLPVVLEDLADPLSGFVLPKDAQTGASYTYTATGKFSFELCAEFNKAGGSSAFSERSVSVPAESAGLKGETLWNHEAGHQCFARTIDPERYPPVKR